MRGLDSVPDCNQLFAAKAILRAEHARLFEPEINILKECPECVLNYYIPADSDDGSFCKPCVANPHLPVWVKHYRSPYWPAKLIAINRHQPSNKVQVTVWFFGPKKETAIVSFDKIRFLTDDFAHPDPDKRKHKKHYKAAVQSLKKYVSAVQQLFDGQAVKIFWPPSQTVYDKETITCVVMDEETDELDDSLDTDSFIEKLFSATEVTKVPQKHLQSVLSYSRWIHNVPIDSMDAAKLVSHRSVTVDLTSCTAAVDQPATPSTAVSTVR